MGKNRRLAVILIGIAICFGFGNRAQAKDKIILKTMIVNPSKTKIQKAMLKTYLPREAKPEDVIDMEDLQIDYDISQECYYVYKEFNLKPGNSVVRSIAMKDIWFISNEELDSFIKQANDKEFVAKLKNTVYFKAAVKLQESIEAKCRTILSQQARAQDAFSQVHIAVYRQNRVIVEEIKDSLDKLAEMALKSKLTKSGSQQARIFVNATWWVILAVIIFLGVISLIFFFVWQHQAKNSEIESKKEKKEEETSI